MEKFQKILVANRGEIAVRIIRACRELGIPSVAVYSEADREALHVMMADEAYLIGPPPARESYLAIENIIKVAKESGADAVHPGYGFLSENAEFAHACQEAGLTFVGPSAHAIRTMGDKIAARQAAMGMDVPVVPGTEKPLEHDDEGLRVAREIGYPVMVKAAMGGGGKGMRLVEDETGLIAALRMARAEAKSAFGDPTVYLEKYLEEPRHIEIQLLADSAGSIVYLGERECSIQRRHQKLIEECPSSFVDFPFRLKMGEAACRVAEAVGYVNAGTVEFLVDRHRNFYFLEMNTRLQVEHPVTELVTGIDLVKEQIRIAAGEPLGYSQEEIFLRGWAIESRIYAEDPFKDFLPSPGVIRGLRTPSGPWVRDDSGVYEGFEVPIHYDPLISKLSVWGHDRQDAIRRMTRALSEYKVVGVRTTIPILQHVMAHPDFLAGRLSTHFLQQAMIHNTAHAEGHHRNVAIIAAALSAYQRESRPVASSRSQLGPSPWALSLRPGGWSRQTGRGASSKRGASPPSE
jgi:acetyl-CoA carboxylase biotin carboxylase subunit